MPDSQPLYIRPARDGDGDEVWPLARDFATSFAPAREAFDDTWRTLAGAPDTLVVVAESGHLIVGYLLANCHLTGHNRCNDGHVCPRAYSGAP